MCFGDGIDSTWRSLKTAFTKPWMDVSASKHSRTLRHSVIPLLQKRGRYIYISRRSFVEREFPPFPSLTLTHSLTHSLPIHLTKSNCYVFLQRCSRSRGPVLSGCCLRRRNVPPGPAAVPRHHHHHHHQGDHIPLELCSPRDLQDLRVLPDHHHRLRDPQPVDLRRILVAEHDRDRNVRLQEQQHDGVCEAGEFLADHDDRRPDVSCLRN